MEKKLHINNSVSSALSQLYLRLKDDAVDDVFPSRTSSQLVFRIPRNCIFGISFVFGEKVDVSYD